LPEQERNREASFKNVDRVSTLEEPGGVVQVFAGSYGSVTSPGPHFSELIGIEVQIHPGATLELAV
jgi:redox-sensitive bicupin YhaK (pirin superfamily)